MKMKKLVMLSMGIAMAGAASANYLVNGGFESSFTDGTTVYDGSSNSYAYCQLVGQESIPPYIPGWSGARYWGYVWNPTGSGGTNHYNTYIGLTSASEGNGCFGSFGVVGQTYSMWQNTGVQAAEGDLVTVIFDLNSLSADYAAASMNLHLQFIGGPDQTFSYDNSNPKDTWATWTNQTVVSAAQAGCDIQVGLEGTGGIWVDNIRLEIQPHLEIEKVAGSDDVDVSWTLNKDTSYVLESRDNLLSGSWTTNAAGLGAGGTSTFRDAIGGSAEGYYRLLIDQFTYNWDFETGTLETWTKTGNAFDLQPVATNWPCWGYQGTYLIATYLDGFAGGGTGVLTSATTTLEPDQGLAFRLAGWSAEGGAGTDFSYVTLNRVSDDAELDRIWAPGAEGYMAKDQLNHGQSSNVNVYVQVVDDAANAWGWIAVDGFRRVPAHPTFEENNGFELGTVGDWTRTGNAFISQPVATNWPSWGYQGGYLVNTAHAANFGAGGIGTMTSPSFNLETNEAVAFLMGGWSTAGGAGTDFCYVTLNRADNSNELDRVWAPGVDGYMGTCQLTPTSALTTNTAVFVEVVDDVANAWAWLSVDNFRVVLAEPTFEQNSGFEIGTLGGWTRTGYAFVSQPVTGTTALQGAGYEGNYHVNTYFAANYGEGATGTLTSPNFTMQADEDLSFLMAGWSGVPPATNMWNHIALFDASSDTELDRVWAPGDNSMATNTLSHGTNIAMEVYVKVVDDRAGAYGWIAVDDFQIQ